MESAESVQALLTRQRDDAARSQSRGPTVLIAGPTDAGKSSLCRKLIWKELSTKKRPILFADLDIGQGEVSIPGTIGAAVIDPSFLSQIDTPDLEAFGEERLHPIVMFNPFVYYVGHTSMSEKEWLYQWFIKQLAARIAEKQSSDANLAASGVVVNTCGWIEGRGYRLLLDGIRSFRPNLVIVMGDHKLYEQLLHESVSVVFLPRSPLVQTRSSSFRRQARLSKIRDYFSRNLQPPMPFFQVQVGIDAIKFYRFVQSNQPRHLVQVKREHIVETMAQKIVAMYAALASDQHLTSAKVLGFVCIRSIDLISKTVVFVSPCAGPLPSNSFVVGQVEWIEG
ncbi:unnamed protein product [Aphanomyces euteiches]|nr:hypothetical protein AeRB84_012029 [Aphanomyces euteiches]